MVDFAVVGAGIIGLATARALLLAHPGSTVVVFEKEADIGRHQTSHNSGVVHSGIAYQPGSAKAALCVEGARRMLEFCEERGIATRRGGKVVVALDEPEIARLDELEAQGNANGVEGLRIVDGDGLRALEPASGGVAALHVPGTAVVNFAQVARVLAADVADLGGTLTLRAPVRAVHGGDGGAVVELASGERHPARLAVACAGLQSDRLAATSGATRTDLRIVPFRGSYFTLSQRAASLVRSMIYPVPDPGLPFLGVHFTRHVDDSVSCGPNAVLAPSRERYRRVALNPRDLWDTVRFPGTRRLARGHLSTGLREAVLDLSRGRYHRSARRYLPGLAVDDLLPGASGVRAQVVDSRGLLVDDFVFESNSAVLHVRNAPSPAATASLAIADELVARLLELGG